MSEKADRDLAETALSRKHAEVATEKARADKAEQGLCGASNDLILLRERTEKVEFDCASLRLELQAEKHNHQKDNEHLLARAEKAEAILKAANFCEAHEPIPDQPETGCPMCEAVHQADLREKAEAERDEWEAEFAATMMELGIQIGLRERAEAEVRRLREACGTVCSRYCNWFTGGRSMDAANEYYDSVNILRDGLAAAKPEAPGGTEAGRLRGALEPFAAFAPYASIGTFYYVPDKGVFPARFPSVEDFSRAAKVLAEKGAEAKREPAEVLPKRIDTLKVEVKRLRAENESLFAVLNQIEELLAFKHLQLLQERVSPTDQPMTITVPGMDGGTITNREPAASDPATPEATPGQPERRQSLIHELREFARAYPENIFTPFTEEELKRHSVIITRASAAAGRHFAPWFLKAAAALKRMGADEQRRKDDEWLMRKALDALDRFPCGNRTTIDIGAREALRARLGLGEAAQGKEASDGEAKA